MPLAGTVAVNWPDPLTVDGLPEQVPPVKSPLATSQ